MNRSALAPRRLQFRRAFSLVELLPYIEQAAMHDIGAAGAAAEVRRPSPANGDPLVSALLPQPAQGGRVPLEPIERGWRSDGRQRGHADGRRPHRLRL